MLARLYKREDAEGLDALLDGNRDGDVRLDRDTIVVVGHIGEPKGVLVWRKAAYIHEFYCGKGLSQRAIADALANFTLGQNCGELREAQFRCAPENKAMQRYVKELGAVQEEGLIYRLPLL
jgi:hypothetical protein